MYTLSPLPAPVASDSPMGFYIWIAIVFGIVVWAGFWVVGNLRTRRPDKSELASIASAGLVGAFVLAMITHGVYEASFHPTVPVNKARWATFVNAETYENQVYTPKWGMRVHRYDFIHLIIDETGERVRLEVPQLELPYPPKIQVYWNPPFKERERL